jgi:hypothetical protein
MKVNCLLPLLVLVLVTSTEETTQIVAQEVAQSNEQKLSVEPDASRSVSQHASVTPALTLLMPTSNNPVNRSAYEDVFNILSAENSCSNFFGGAAVAVSIFSQLSTQLRAEPFAQANLGIKMSGSITQVKDMRTGASYRLFEKASINSLGPFYMAKNVLPGGSQRAMISVGGFQSNTREARATLLLHELGHLVMTQDGKWLLPDDGDNADKSLRNTKTVLQHCGDQIKSLRSAKHNPNSSKIETTVTARANTVSEDTTAKN